MSEPEFLECPACNRPCKNIKSCPDEHECDAEYPDGLRYWWCEDREGTCECGARLRVVVEDGHAWLEEVDAPDEAKGEG
jgi:hypothetical protein